MITHIPIFTAVRTLCAKGPTHKNDLVRSATARLLVCIVVIAGSENILSPNSNDHTKRRLITNMVKFLDDKCSETRSTRIFYLSNMLTIFCRKYGERLYKLFSKETNFDTSLKQFLSKEDISQMDRSLKLIEKRR